MHRRNDGTNNSPAILRSEIMWYLMENIQRSYALYQRLMMAIGVEGIDSETDGNLNLEEVEDLLNQGADVNQPHGSFVPLHAACLFGHPEIVSLLLKWNADVNQYDGFHRCALHYAAEKNVECTRLLLQAGAKTELRDLNENTALHWAAFRNKPDICRLLLQHKADVNAKDANHDTPLNWAAMKSNLESVRVLLEYNAAPDIMSHARMLPVTRVAILLAAGLYTDQDETCFELLIRSMGQLELRYKRPNGSNQIRLPEPLARDVDLSERLTELCSSPQPLKKLTRFAIRKSLCETYLPDAVNSLVLPRTLQKYILLEY